MNGIIKLFASTMWHCCGADFIFLNLPASGKQGRKNVSKSANKTEARKTDLIMYTQIRPHFIMWSKFYHVGQNVIMWSKCYHHFLLESTKKQIIWCCFMVLSCGMITHTPFHYCIKAYHCVCSQLRPKFLPVVIAGIWKILLDIK